MKYNTGGCLQELYFSQKVGEGVLKVPDHEGESEVLTGIENIIPAGVRQQNLSDVADRLVGGGGKYYIRAPYLQHQRNVDKEERSKVGCC